MFDILEAMKGVEPLSSGLQDRRSVIQLSYIAKRIWWTGRDSNPHKKFAGLLCCRYITSPEKHCQFPIVDCRLKISVFTVRQLQTRQLTWSRRRESNPHPSVYETDALPLELLRNSDLGSPRRS